MKKCFAMLLALAMSISLAACGQGGTPSNSNSGGNAGTNGGSSAAAPSENKPLTIKLADLNSEQGASGLWCQRIKKSIEDANVNITVEYYPNGSLVSQDIEAIQAGICDMMMTTFSTAAGIWDPLGAFDAPYIIENTDQAKNIFDYNSAAAVAMNETLPTLGIRYLGAYYSGGRMTTTTNKAIYSVDDMKSVKFRVVNGDLWISLFRAFGAEPTPMAMSEVSTALVTGVCEGQENPYNAIVSNNLYEIQKYVIETNHMPANYPMWINENTFQKMSAEQQQVVIDAVQEASTWNTDRLEEMGDSDKQTCLDNGMTCISVEDGLDIESFRTAAMTIYDEYADKWGDMPDIIRSCY